MLDLEPSGSVLLDGGRCEAAADGWLSIWNYSKLVVGGRGSMNFLEFGR